MQPAAPDDNATMRSDATPPTGGPAGCDPAFAFEQLVRQASVDIGLLNPLITPEVDPGASQATCSGLNSWLAAEWLDSNNEHGRWRGMLSVAHNDPVGAAREIEKWAGHRQFVSVMMVPEARPAFGDPRYYPIYEAASRHDLPVATHIARGPFELNPISPVGYQSYWHAHNAGVPLVYLGHIFSLIFNGVFEKFPKLQFVFVEGACSWLLPSLWRMDRYWEARKSELPEVKRRPSEYARDHIWITTQPLEDPDDSAELTRLFEWMESDKFLLFSSDYPHWTFDDPQWAANRFPKAHRSRIMSENAIELFHLPSIVPAIG
jgi:predicted TIM-barrel fold metal-dependent hydrolase